jgi:hypothetical protein
MKLHQLFLALGEDSFKSQLRGISMGTLRTYQIHDRVKARLRLAKLNTENIRLAAPKLFARLQEGDEELAIDLSQSILVSQLKMIGAILDFFQIPHEDGFFGKDTNPKDFLPEGWQAKAYEEFREKYPPVLLVFYLNHLAIEMEPDAAIYQPA